MASLKDTERLTAERLGFEEGVVCRLAMGSIPKVSLKLYLYFVLFATSFSYCFPQKIPESVFNRFYVTLMLHDLWNEVPVFEVSQKYQVSFCEGNFSSLIEK